VHCLLWNEALAERRRAWGERRESLGFSAQCKRLTAWRRQWKLLRGINAQSEQVTLKRLDRAFEHFFRRVNSGETPGFPRFKALHRFKGWGDKRHGDGWRLVTNERMKHGTRRLAGVGDVAIRGKPRTPGTPKTCEILYRQGRWYASIPLDCEPARARGAHSIPNPRHLHRSRRLQRSISRKEEAEKKASGQSKHLPVSNRLRREYGQRRRLHRQVANQRHDFVHQTTAALVGQYGALGLESLDIKNMTASGGQRKKGLNRAILDAAGGVFHQQLGYKAAEADPWAMEAPTRQIKPSQTCHACGRRQEKPLKQRHHACACGASCSRDTNAARVLLAWAEQQLAGREPADAWREVRPHHPPDESARPSKRETRAIA